MTQDLAESLGSYTQEQIIDITRQEEARVKSIQKQLREERAVARNAPTGQQFSALNQIHDNNFRDRRLILDSLDRNHIKMDVGQFDLFKVQGDKEFGFANTARGVITAYGEERSDSAMKFAARAVQHQAEVVNVTFVETYNIKQDTMSGKPIMDKKAITRSYTTECYCREPETRDTTSEMLMCTDCPTRFHRQCLPNAEQRDKELTCPKDTLPIDGFQWSAGQVANTCTVDNFLTAVTLKSIKHPRFQEYITRQTKYSDVPLANNRREGDIGKMLNKTIEQGKREQYADAQATYATLLSHKNPTVGDGTNFDLWGSEKENVFDLLKDGGSFIQSTRCNQCKFELDTEPTADPLVGLPTYMPMMKYQLEKGSFQTTKCPRCPDGIMSKSGLRVPDENNPPWFLHVETDMAGYRIREATWCPKEITVEGKYKYDLAYITLQSSNHFSSIQNIDDMLVMYDGQGRNAQNREEKFFLIPTDQLHQDYSTKIVNSVTYFLDTDSVEESKTKRGTRASRRLNL